MAKVIVSTGHYGKNMALPGAVGSGYKEAEEARKVVNRVVAILGKEAIGYTDLVSRNQRDNLNNIVRYHNSKARQLDCSIHFNAGGGTGVEVLHYDMPKTAAKWSAEFAKVLDLRDRGQKVRKELYFLNSTNKPALLIEVCFIDSKTDMASYKKNFEKLCQSIAKMIAEEVGIELAAKKPVVKNVHTVKAGETLWGISTKYKITVEKIKSLNGLKSNVIQPGQKLKIK